MQSVRDHFSCMWVVCFIAFDAWGQAAPISTPDAGSVMQQIESGQRLHTPVLQSSPTAPATTLTAPKGPTVTLRRFRFAGNATLSSEYLRELTKPWLGRPLIFSELSQVARIVTDAYREAGYLARAEFRAQDLTGGVATLLVTEGRMGNLHIEGDRLARLEPKKLQQLVDASQKKGDLIRVDQLDRALLLADDLPGVAVSGKLATGTQPGETDLVLTAKNEPLLSGKVVGDNAGSRATGTARILGRLGFSSPLSLGDQAALSLLHSQGSNYSQASYGLPVGARGMQVGLAASYLEYRLISPEYRALNASGRSTVLESLASYPLVRSASANIFAGLTLANKRYVNQINSFYTSSYNVNTATLGLWGNRLNTDHDGWLSGSMYWVAGNLDLDRSPSKKFDASGPKTAGNFNLLRLQAAYQQNLGNGVAFNLRYRGQFSSKNLDSSEKFYLGGPSGVRAFSVGESGGSEGNVINIELQSLISKNFRLTAFVDWGQVITNRHPWDVKGKDRYDISGAGFGLDLLGVKDVQLQLIWARRLGANPRSLANGNDQDGSYKRNRFWLTVGLYF